MTVIADTMRSISGATDRGPLYFYAPVLRDSADLSAIITPQYHLVGIDSAGDFTTPDLQPGPAKVRIDGVAYHIAIPDSPTPIRLWPLIDALIEQPPTTTGYVRNGGGIARAQRVTESEYAALVTPDPETLYAVVED